MTARKQLIASVLLIFACVAAAMAQSQPLPASISRSRFAYSLSDDSRLAVYLIDSQTGQERNLGYVLAPGDGPSDLALDPQSRFLYVANSRSNDIAAFRTNQPGFPVPVGNTPAGAGPAALAIDPGGHFVYVANQLSGDVSSFLIDDRSGALLPNGPNLPAGGGSSALAIDPLGRFVYVANHDSNDVAMYRIDPASGMRGRWGRTCPPGCSPAAWPSIPAATSCT